MKTNVYSIFEHPNNGCMSYWTHMKFALKLSYIFFISSGKSFIHGFIPSLFRTSSSEVIILVDNLIKNNGCNNNYGTQK